MNLLLQTEEIRLFLFLNKIRTLYQKVQSPFFAYLRLASTAVVAAAAATVVIVVSASTAAAGEEDNEKKNNENDAPAVISTKI